MLRRRYSGTYARPVSGGELAEIDAFVRARFHLSQTISWLQDLAAELTPLSKFSKARSAVQTIGHLLSVAAIEAEEMGRAEAAIRERRQRFPLSREAGA